jgi:hypothetical protein
MSIFVSNLDDFIAPSQACVNPLVSSKLSSAGAGAVEGAGATANSTATATAPTKKAVVSLSNDYSTSAFTPKAREPDLIKNTASATNPARQVATVSVADCLACRCVLKKSHVINNLISFPSTLSSHQQSHLIPSTMSSHLTP